MDTNEDEVSDPVRVPINFLRDNAADTDFFGSHQRVADAIAAVIDKNADLKVIGLLGPWGSGKSTVVKLMEQRLAGIPTPQRVFTYDAWLHQSDPPRRAFLEQFVNFLIREKLAEAEAWQEPMDLLSRRLEETDVTTTPRLTLAGHLLILSLAAIPIGTRMLGPDWFAKMLEHGPGVPAAWIFPVGILLSAAPLLTVLVLYLSWRPTLKFWKRAFWAKANLQRHRKPHENDSLLALIANKTVQHQNSRVTKSPEPTTIEFQETFRNMLLVANKDGRRLVIVVDNLDRLPETEAIAMWSTIRSFFLGALPAGESVSALAMPSVILPIDDQAVARMYGSALEADRDNLARSFMDKTFDMTFHVSGPVLSDWNAYLAEQLEKIFGKELSSEWAFEVGRIYGRQVKDRVTPRDLNRLANAIGALWLQWQPQKIPFISVAYYAIQRVELDRDLLQAIGRPLVDLTEYDPDWQRSLAAIHFGVIPEHALQILLAPKLQEAIDKSDDTALGSQIHIRGFEQVLLKYLEEEEKEGSLANIAKLVRVLNNADVANESWLPMMWKKLRSAYLRTDLVLNTEHPGQIFLILLEKIDGKGRTAFIDAVSARLSGYEAAFFEKPKALAGVHDLLTIWIPKARAAGGDRKPVTIANASAYLSLASVDRNAGTSRSLVRSPTTPDRLASTFVARLEKSELFADALDAAKLVLLQAPSEDNLKELADRARGIIDRDEEHVFKTEAAIHILGSLRTKHEFAAQHVSQLANQGTLQERTQQAFGRGQTRLASRMAALMIVEGYSAVAPSGESWQSYLSATPEFVIDLDADILAYGSDAFLHHISEIVQRDAAARPLGEALMLRRLQAKTLGSLFTSSMVSNIAPYTSLLPEDQRANFAAELSLYDSFWENLAANWTSTSGQQIYGWLIGAGHDLAEQRKKARSALRAAIKALGSDPWKDIIRDDGGVLHLALHLQKLEGRPLAVGNTLFSALREFLPELTQEEHRPFAPSWFVAASLLSADGRRNLMKLLRDRLNAMTEIPNLLGLLRSGSELLLDNADFAAHADESVSHILIPLAASDDGILWMSDHIEKLALWVRQANRSTRTFLNEQLRDRGHESSEQTQKLIKQLQGGWDLSQSK